MAVTSMLCVQTGAALSTHLFDALTPAGSAWLRVGIAAVILLAITRPQVHRMSRSTLLGILVLGAVTAEMNLTFIEAVARIPLGTTVAIEFLGPLGVAALRSRRRSALVWPGLALVGVVGLTEPWHGSLNLAGVAYAASAALGWGAYILLTQRVGAQVEGLQGLALSLATAAVVATPFAVGPVVHGITPLVALAGVGLAVLMPLLPFSLEMTALRRMGAGAFGTLMALEPGIAVVIGLVMLSQRPAPWQVAGIVLVVVAGVGAARGDARSQSDTLATGSEPALVPVTTA